MNVTLAEAASILGVSKETLRNWDRSGKLKSLRDPNNNYRLYRLADLEALERPSVREAAAIYDAKTPNHVAPPIEKAPSPDQSLKRTVSKLHRILRDTDGNSSIVERFDEATKLLFLSLRCGASPDAMHTLGRKPTESERLHANRIRQRFDKEAASNPELFPFRFRKLTLSDTALSSAANFLASVEIPLTHHDVKGLAYEEMIRNTFEKGDNQQFFTPPSIASFLVELMTPYLHGVICDPAAGTGGFLVEIARRQIPATKLVALEIDERLAWVGGINLFVNGAPNFETKWLANGGSLGRAGEALANTVDAIVTNPPFGSDFSEREDLERYILGKGRSSRRRGVLFIERCLAMLKEGGVLGIVIDEGVLSLPSNADVREVIMGQADLLAVVSLPESAFMPYASVSTSILLLRKNARSRLQRLTFFARADNVGRKANGEPDIEYTDQGQHRLVTDLPGILDAWETFQKSGKLGKHNNDVFLADALALIRSDQSGSNRIDYKFHHPARLAAQLGLKDCRFRLAPLSEICRVRNDSYVPSVDFADQVIPYTGLAHIESRVGRAHQVLVPGNSLKSSVKRYERGDILFAKMRPNLRKVALMDVDQPGFASAECVVLSVKEDLEGYPIVDGSLLSILLRSDYVFGQIIHLIAGIGRPRISLKDLLAVQIPVPPRSHQAAFKETFLKTRENYESLRLEARRLSEVAGTMELGAIESLADSFIGK